MAFKFKIVQTRRSSCAFGICFLDQISHLSPKPPVVIRDNQDAREKAEEEEQKNINFRILGPQRKHKQEESVCFDFALPGCWREHWEAKYNNDLLPPRGLGPVFHAAPIVGLGPQWWQLRDHLSSWKQHFFRSHLGFGTFYLPLCVQG